MSESHADSEGTAEQPVEEELRELGHAGFTFPEAHREGFEEVQNCISEITDVDRHVSDLIQEALNQEDQ
jgi:hypothetical protein